MRIAYTCQDISVTGGLERIFVDKANAMAAAGHDVCLIVNNPPGTHPAYDIDARVRLIDLSLAQPQSYAGTVFFKLRQNHRMAKALRSFRPDIVVGVPTWIVSSMLTGRWHFVLESHCSRPLMFIHENRSIYKRLKVAIAERRADVTVTLTQQDRANWRYARRVETIVNFSNIKARETGAQRRDILAVGRLNNQKRFDILIDAWRIVSQKHPDRHLDIYGEGEERPTLQARIDSHGLTNIIQLRGNTQDIGSEYASHEFLVMSSQYEGLPLVLIEAMTCGCPCVSVDCPCGPREIIADGEDGLLVPYNDCNRDQQIQDLAAAICKMIENPDMTATFSRNAIRNAQRFDKQEIIKRWQQLFKQLP